MLKSRNNFIRNYLSVSLTEQHMATLASIIKDVDKDVKGTYAVYAIYHLCCFRDACLVLSRLSEFILVV